MTHGGLPSAWLQGCRLYYQNTVLCTLVITASWHEYWRARGGVVGDGGARAPTRQRATMHRVIACIHSCHVFSTVSFMGRIGRLLASIACNMRGDAYVCPPAQAIFKYMAGCRQASNEAAVTEDMIDFHN